MVSGVYATWSYAAFGPTPQQTGISASLSVFDYPPEQVLPGGGTDYEIEAYRTTLEKIDGEWKATVSYKGYAPTIRLRDLGLSPDPKALIYTIQVDKWHI